MTSLRHYTTDEAEHLAACFRQSVADRIITLEAARLALEQFKFRDLMKVYWTVGPQSETWYRFGRGEWRAAKAPLTALEAPAILRSWDLNAALREPEEAVQTLAGHNDDTNTADWLTKRNLAIGAAYQAAQLTSDMAIERLSRLCLLDKTGRFWTVGAQSGAWFVFEGRQWVKASAAPAPESLMNTLAEGRRNAPSEKIIGRIEDFLECGADVLPEPLTDEWNPPADFPEPVRPCPVCRMVNVTEKGACYFCGSDLRLAPAHRICPRCGAVLRPNKKFCTACGARMT